MYAAHQYTQISFTAPSCRSLFVCVIFFSQMLTNKSSRCVLIVSRFCRNPFELRVFQGSVRLTEFLCGEGRESTYIGLRYRCIIKH